MGCRLKYLLLLTFYINSANAQLLPFKTFTTKDGLVSNQVTAVIEDKRGLLWVGTVFGITLFDGHRFSEPSPIPEKQPVYVTGFFNDADSNTWVLTFYNGIYRFKDDHFINYRPDSLQVEANANSIFSMIQYDDNSFIVATDQNIYWFDGHKFSLFDPANSLLNKQFTSVLYHKKKWLFFGCSTGIVAYSKNNGRWEYAGRMFTELEVNNMNADDEKIFVCTDKGLLIFDDPEHSLRGVGSKTLLNGHGVYSATKHPVTNEWWICSDKLYRLGKDSLVGYDFREGLPAIPSSVYFDKANITWACSGKGLTRLVKENSIFYDLRSGPSHSMITSIATNGDGDLWLGTYNGITSKRKNSFKTYHQLNGERLGYISWMIESDDGKIIAGTETGIASIHNNSIHAESPLQTTRAFKDTKGTIWAGTLKGDIYTWDGDNARKINQDNELKDHIDGVVVDEHGNVWVGYRGHGIRKYQIRDNMLRLEKEYSAKTGHPDLKIRSSFIDRQGNIYFGTRTNGLFIIRAKKDSTTILIDRASGLADNWVKHITQDQAGIVYVATNKGVNILTFSGDRVDVKKITLQHEDLTEACNFIYAGENKIWVGTEAGLLEYHNPSEILSRPAPIIYLTEVAVNGRKDSTLSSYLPFAEKKFPSGVKVVSFSFAGVDLSADAPLHYRYKLEGQDKDWIYAGDRNFVSYNLPPGRYTFRAQAQHAGGQWSEQSASFSFIISTPFWKSWWFVASLLLLSAIILFLVYRYHLRQALQVERLRSRISTDLHDDIGSTLSSISILSDMASHEKDYTQSSGMMQEIKHSSVSLMEKMDDIVWSINPRNDSIQDLMVRVKRFAATLFEAKDIDYTILIDDSIREARLNMESRQHIYLIMKEAINNLAKYSQCTRADIDVKYRNNILAIEIRDNGIGFNEQSIRLGNGLISMRKRAEAINAVINICSSEVKGTTVFLQTKIK